MKHLRWEIARRIRKGLFGLPKSSFGEHRFDRNVCSPNEDSRWWNETLDEVFRRIFQGCGYSIWDLFRSPNPVLTPFKSASDGKRILKGLQKVRSAFPNLRLGSIILRQSFQNLRLGAIQFPVGSTLLISISK